MEHITLAKASTSVSGSDKSKGNSAGAKAQVTDETATVTDSVYGTDALAAMITTEPEPTEDITTDLVKENPFRYAGYYFDRKTQYYYLQARYYDPRPARFISEDTYEGQIDNPLSLNLYTYVENNSLNYTDPSGHMTDANGAGGGDYDLTKVPITKLTLAQVLVTYPQNWKFFNKRAKGLEMAKEYYYLWYHGTKAYKRLDEATLGHNSYLVYKFNSLRKQSKDLSKLTVAKVDKMSLENARFWFRAETAAFTAYGSYKIAKAYIAAPKNATMGMGNFLSKPATKNGTLNIGAGGKPIEGAYNIDLAPRTKGVHSGDATKLSNIKTGSQSKIYIENPYGYDPLNSEVLRVLSRDGEIIITGSRSNLNKILKTMDDKGLKIKGNRRDIPNDGSYKTTDGEDIKSEMLDQYTIIRK